jgi:hypothetical protein
MPTVRKSYVAQECLVYAHGTKNLRGSRMFSVWPEYRKTYVAEDCLVYAYSTEKPFWL